MRILTYSAVVLLFSISSASADDTLNPAADTAKAAATGTVDCPAPANGMTSADYLVTVVKCLHQQTDQERVALVEDIHIKSWSYAILNKGAFWIAVGLAVLVLVWPSFVALASVAPRQNPDQDVDNQAKQSQQTETDPTKPGVLRYLRSTNVASALQTSIAALAALTFAFYAHYKGNQVTAENLMREIIFTEKIEANRMSAILAAIAEMDKGFSLASVEGPGEGN